MSTQDGKTEEENQLALMRERAEDAFQGKPVPDLKVEEEDTKAPEQVEAVKTAEESKETEPAKKGEPEPAKAAETTPAPEVKVPDKYQGKTLEEVLKIAQDQDSYIGKLGSEKSYEKSEAEKFRAELDSLKSQLDVKQTQDQEESLKQGLEADPAKAIMDYIDQKTGSVEQKVEQDKLDRSKQESQTYYNGLLGNSDFVRRQPHVEKVAGALKQYVKPEFLNSPGFIEVCDLVSKGTDIDYYVQQSQTEAASKKEAALQEKRDVQAVTGSSSGQTVSTSTTEMTEADLKKRAYAAFVKQGE